MPYSEEEYLQLSGIHHFAFCRRRWALIHLEQQWAENLRTVRGNIFHERVHDGSVHDWRGGAFIVCGLRVSSPVLGVSGVCDVVEFYASEKGVPINGKRGCWLPYPVEYKRGKPLEVDADRLQLCAQAICLEEMFSCEVLEGSLFYGETRRREQVEFTDVMRERLFRMLDEMHHLLHREHTPMVKPTKSCNACSLNECCLPKLMTKKSAREYVSSRVFGDDE